LRAQFVLFSRALSRLVPVNTARDRFIFIVLQSTPGSFRFHNNHSFDDGSLAHEIQLSLSLSILDFLITFETVSEIYLFNDSHQQTVGRKKKRHWYSEFVFSDGRVKSKDRPWQWIANIHTSTKIMSTRSLSSSTYDIDHETFSNDCPAVQCRVQYLDDIDPFSNVNLPEPTRPPLFTLLTSTVLNSQLSHIHRLLHAPHKVRRCSHWHYTTYLVLPIRYPIVPWNCIDKMERRPNSDLISILISAGMNNATKSKHSPKGKTYTCRSLIRSKDERCLCQGTNGRSSFEHNWIFVYKLVLVRIDRCEWWNDSTCCWCLDKLSHSVERELRRSLFSLKQLFQVSRESIASLHNKSHSGWQRPRTRVRQ
jgi:hypothetical protein